MEQPNEYLRIDGISKRYGVVQALDDVSFNVYKGEIHAISGENGAGKSTLVKIIMGETAPDSGSIYLDGIPMKTYTPLYARSRGVQMVHQELAIFENMSVAENVFPWNEFRGKIGTIKRKTLYKETQKKLNLFGLRSIKPEQMMRDLTLDGQQIVEILRCVSANPNILLLDEPSSGLNDKESENLMKILKRLRDEGLTILYISHRLREILDISDRVTILRDGRFICTLNNDDKLTESILINNMVGRDLSGSLYRQKVYKRDAKSEADILLEVKGLSKKQGIANTSFDLKKGEILGFFGLEGSGTEKLSRMMYGLESKDTGEIFFKGKKIKKINPNSMIENKILYMNNNRKFAGLLLDMPTTDNFAMPILKKISRRSFIDFNTLGRIVEKYIKEFSIMIPSIKTKPKNLSGGNQQKVMMAICLAAEPELLIANEPTRGIDVGAKAEIHKLLLKFAEQGVGIIIFSSELPELIGLADRIIVMKNMKISGELSGIDIDEQSLMTYAAANTEKERGEMA